MGDPNGLPNRPSVVKWKARWVVRGFTQIEGIDYFETFASVVKPMSYKALFAIAAAYDLEIEQMDVTTAFLYGDIDTEVYVEQPHGYEDGTGRACLLKKALYGLKQSPRIWYQTLSSFLRGLGFEPLAVDMGVFHKGNYFIAVYVDDLLIIGPDKKEIQIIKDALSNRFKMVDIGPCKYYLGMEIHRDRPNRTLRLSQKGYIDRVLFEFGMQDCKPLGIPMDPKVRLESAPEDYIPAQEDKEWYARLVGSLMYIMLGTRADIAFTVSALSRYLAKPTDQHLLAAKRVLRYLRGSSDLVLVYRGDLRPLIGYTDADWGGDMDTRRSTSGYLFNIGSGAISWSSKRQPTVALSSCEAEYMGEAQATKEAIWLRNLLTELNSHRKETQATIIYGDNQGAIALAQNPQFHARTKHIDIQHHFVRENQDKGLVDIQYISTDNQIADGLTKALPKDAFHRFRKSLGLETYTTGF
jgi:reverse transcriptase-like protein